MYFIYSSLCPLALSPILTDDKFLVSCLDTLVIVVNICNMRVWTQVRRAHIHLTRSTSDAPSSLNKAYLHDINHLSFRLAGAG